MVQKDMMFSSDKFIIHSNADNDLNRIRTDIFDNDEYLAAFGGKTIVDVGACIGLFTMYAYPFAKKIYAIEPHPRSYLCLVNNVRDNELDLVSTHNLAISDANEYGYIKDNGVLEGAFFTKETTPNRVETRTLATFFKDNNIEYADIVKIDTEGSEFRICAAPDFQELKDKIGCIIMEVHGSEAPRTFPDWKAEKLRGNIYIYKHV